MQGTRGERSTEAQAKLRETRSRLVARRGWAEVGTATASSWLSGLGTYMCPAFLRDLGSVVWGLSHPCSAAVQGAGASGLLETKAKAHFTEAVIVARGEGVLGPLRLGLSQTRPTDPDSTPRLQSHSWEGRCEATGPRLPCSRDWAAEGPMQPARAKSTALQGRNDPPTTSPCHSRYTGQGPHFTGTWVG